MIAFYQENVVKENMEAWKLGKDINCPAFSFEKALEIVFEVNIFSNFFHHLVCLHYTSITFLLSNIALQPH